MENKNLFPEALPLEREILTDIYAQTGIAFRRLGGIDPRHERISDLLPILADWVDRLDLSNYRAGCYVCFATPEARPYFDRIVSWWVKEDEDMASSVLSRVLADLIRCDDSERIWAILRQIENLRPDHYCLMSVLALCEPVAREVRAKMFEALLDSDRQLNSLEYIAKVPDPRIRRWFESQINSPDQNLRRIARRVTSKRSFPKGISYSDVPPDRSREEFSTECDLSDLGGLVKSIVRDFGVKIPKPFQSGDFLACADPDRWLVVSAPRSSGIPAALWFRLESVDTVEVVLAGG